MERKRVSTLNIIQLFGLWSVLVCLFLGLASQGFSSNYSLLPAQQSIPLNERVLVVYNQSVPESLAVADYYMARRGIPASNKCAINTQETIYISDWSVFNSLIKTPIKNCLNTLGRDKILYIVFTYQTPYKVGSPVKSLDQQIADIWDEYSADTYRQRQHPYFADAQSQGNIYQPFVSLADYRQQQGAQHLYSVWRLDAPTFEVAKALVDKALLAEVTGLKGRGCFDIRGEAHGFDDYGYGSGDWDIHMGAEHARAVGFVVTEDFNNEEFGTAPAPLRCDDAALYAGWYSLDNYNDAFTWKPGAIGLHTDSASAYNVRSGTNWSANALLKGITVTSGAMDEPYLDGVAHADGVFRNLFEGANVGDALLRNTEYLKWMILNIGDPLYRPFPGGISPYNSPNTGQPSLLLNHLWVGGGGTYQATLTLHTTAPAGGTNVTLTSSYTRVATVPESITVPAGSSTGSFNINTSPVTSSAPARIKAVYPGGTISNTIVVSPNVEPWVSLKSPAEGTTFTAPANINISADAADADGQVTRVDFYADSTLIGTDSTSPFTLNWNNVAAGNYTLTAIATDSAGATYTSDPVVIHVNPAPTPTPTPTPTPANALALLTEEGTGRALALDSVAWVRDPFSVLASPNFGADQRTRLVLFALNLNLQPGETYSAITAQAEDAAQHVYPLAVEYVGKVPPFEWLSQVIVKLPGELAGSGDVWVSINLRGARSNRALVRIKP